MRQAYGVKTIKLAETTKLMGTVHAAMSDFKGALFMYGEAAQRYENKYGKKHKKVKEILSTMKKVISCFSFLVSRFFVSRLSFLVSFLFSQFLVPSSFLPNISVKIKEKIGDKNDDESESESEESESESESEESEEESDRGSEAASSATGNESASASDGGRENGEEEESSEYAEDNFEDEEDET